MTHTSGTQPFVLEVPILEDAAVDALHTFLLDLWTQFENQYFAQLHRRQQVLDQSRRDMFEQPRALKHSANGRSADLAVAGGRAHRYAARSTLVRNHEGPIRVAERWCYRSQRSLRPVSEALCPPPRL